MKTPILVALIAATALMPFAAGAQDWRGRGGRERSEARPDDGDRGERPQPAQQQAAPQPRQFDSQRFDQPGRGQGFEQRGGQRPDGGQRFDQRGDQSRGDGQRFNPGGRFQRGEAVPQAPQSAPVPEARRDFGRNPGEPRQYGQPNTPDRGSFGQQGSRADRRDFAPGQQFRPDARRDDRRDAVRNDRRRDWSRDGDWARGTDWSRGNDWGRGNNWARSNNWSRDWRSDRRYDWQGWRNQNRNAYRLPRYYAPRGYNYGYQRFGIGVTLGAILFSQDYWIDDPWAYRLPPAYGPYRWVRYYNDALLVDVEDGEVVDVIHDIFW